MARQARITAVPFGTSGTTDDFETFGSDATGTPVYTQDPASIQAGPAWATGWRSALIASKAPVLQDMNGKMLVDSTQIFYMLQQGVPEYDAGTTYYQNNLVMKTLTGEMYMSAIDNNVGNALPSRVSNSDWTYVGALTSLAQFAQYRRPNLTAVSSTTVSVETGLNGASGQALIVFPDGQFISQGGSTLIVLDVTRVASLGGSPQSGLRTGTVASNTWYAVYAVKANSATEFVLVADTVLPVAGSYATLNTNFGVGSWVYLGLIRYGDGGGTATGILPFFQCGNKTLFNNTGTGENVAAAPGILMNTTAGAATLAYAYTSGVAGAVTPANITHAVWTAAGGAVATGVSIRDSGNSVVFVTLYNGGVAVTQRVETPVQLGLHLSNNAATSIAWDIFLSGFVDTCLGVGSNPAI